MSDADWDEHMSKVTQSKIGQVDQHFLPSVRVQEDESTEGTESAWIPWGRATDMEGGKLSLQETAEGNNVITKRNPKLSNKFHIPLPSEPAVR